MPRQACADVHIVDVERHFAVETLVDGHWVVRRFARLRDARRFARREMKRLDLGLVVHEVKRAADGTVTDTRRMA